MHGLVILDSNDNVIRPAILWNDGRCDKETAYLNEVIGKEKLSDLTANVAFEGLQHLRFYGLRTTSPKTITKLQR